MGQRVAYEDILGNIPGVRVIYLLDMYMGLLLFTEKNTGPKI